VIRAASFKARDEEWETQDETEASFNVAVIVGAGRGALAAPPALDGRVVGDD